MKHRAFSGLARPHLLILIGLLAITQTATSASLTVNASARFGSGTNTYGSDIVSGLSLLPDLSTGLLVADNDHLRVTAEGSANLPGNAFGSAARWDGSSVTTGPNANRNWTLNGVSEVRMDDTISVTSSTLAAGTPVTVNFALVAAHSLFVSHSVPFDGPRNQAVASVSLTGGVTTGGSLGDRYDLTNNVAAKSTSGPVDYTLGIFDPATPLLAFSVDAKVGGELRFKLDARASTTNGALAPFASPTLGLTVTDGKASASVGVAFGADAGTDVVLMSALYGGAFPALSAATTAAALSAMPVSAVPLPPAGLLFAAGILTLARRVRRRGRGPGAGGRRDRRSAPLSFNGNSRLLHAENRPLKTSLCTKQSTVWPVAPGPRPRRSPLASAPDPHAIHRSHRFAQDFGSSGPRSQAPGPSEPRAASTAIRYNPKLAQRN